MKQTRFVLSALVLLGAVVAVVACSSSDESGPPVEQATGVCGTSMSMGEGAQDDCVNASCCTEFVACNDDAACAACLGGQGEGCESDALLAAFWSCFEANQCDSPAGTGGAGGEAGAAGSAGSAGTGGGGQACEGSQIECGGKCVDTQTDGANCGTCGRDCLGATCTAGACAPEVLSDSEYVTAMVLDGDNVYYAQLYSLRKLSKSGGTPEVLNGELGGEVNELYLHDGKLYWPRDEAFHYVPVSGGQTTDVPASFSFIHSRFEFAKGSAYGVGACSNVYRYSMTDGSNVQMTKDGCNIFGGTEPFALAPDGATAFVVFDKPNSVHELWNVKPSAGSHTVIDKALNATELQYDNGIVYFVLGGKVGRIDASGANRKVIGDPAKAAPGEGLTKVSGIRIRGGRGYYQAYKDGGSSAIVETELDGSASRIVARHTEYLKVWDVDDKYVFFATDDGLMRAVK